MSLNLEDTFKALEEVPVVYMEGAAYLKKDSLEGLKVVRVTKHFVRYYEVKDVFKVSTLSDLNVKVKKTSKKNFLKELQ